MVEKGKSASVKPDSVEAPYGRRRLRDVLFIGVGAACLFVLMALLTYSSSDPGWSASGTGAAVSNLGGKTGAFLADSFFSLVGSTAYLVPVLLAYRAVSLLLADDDGVRFDWQLLGFRGLGLLLLLISATALQTLNDGGGTELPQGAGGILGFEIAKGFGQAFNPVGARLVLVALFLLGLTVFCRYQLA